MTNHPSIQKTQPIHHTATQLSNKQRTLTTSVIPSPCFDPWYDRNAIHPGRFTINLYSQDNRKRKDASCLRVIFSASFFRPFSFSLSFFQMHYLSVRPSIMLFLLEAAKGCLSKSSKRFTEHCMNHKLITKNQKVQKCKSLSRLLLNFQPSVITEKRRPLRANHWQVSEKHFTQA